MNRFANLKAEELRPYFQKVAAEMVIPVEIAEKDFWVCWVLKVLFEISDFKEHYRLNMIWFFIPAMRENIHTE